MANLVSVIIPAYNRCEYLKKCVQSILNQTYSDWECIIVDDFSTDDTVSYFTSLSQKDSRIKLFRNERAKGAQGARNTGINNSNGEWIAFLDSDNTFYPEKLSECIKVTEANPQIGVVSHFSTLVNIAGEKTGSFKWIARGYCHQEILSMQAYVDFSQTFISRDILKTIGALDEKCPSYQEWDTHIRISALHSYYFTIERELNYYLSDENLDRISTNQEKEVRGFYFILEKHRSLWKKLGIKNVYCKLVIEGIKKSLLLKKLSAKALAFRFLKLYPPAIYRVFFFAIAKYSK